MTNILVVEDERIVAKDIQKRLKRLGHTVSAVVASGEEAIKKAEDNPDLILMDIILKGKINGIEAAEHIRPLDIPVVFLTAYADEETVNKAKMTVPYGYLVKPFEDRELHATIEIALYKHNMEKRLRESQQWFSTTLKSISDAVVATDTWGVVTFMNAAAETLTGWQHDDAVGKSLDNVFTIESLGERTEPLVERVLNKGEVKAPTTALLTSNGRRIPIDHSATSIKDDKGITMGIVVVFHDITERKKAEEALRASEEKYRDLVENINDVIYAANADGMLTYVSPAVESFIGYTPSDIVGHHFSEFIYEEDLSRLKKNFQSILSGNTTANEYRVVSKSGEIRWMRTSSRPVFTGNRLFGVQGVLADITERKRAELQLKSLFEASKLINSTMDVNEIFGFISDSIQELVGFENLIIFLVPDDKKSVYPAYASGRIKDGVKDLPFGYGEGSVSQCIKAKKPVLSEGVSTEGRKDMADMNSQIVVPLITEGDCIGALHISRSIPNTYTQQDIDVLQPLSEVISSAVRHSKLHNEIKELNQELERKVEEKARRKEILLIAKQNLQTEKNWERGLNTIVESMCTVGFEQCGIFLVNPLRKTLDFHCGKGVNLPDEGTSLPLKDTDYFGVKCVREKRTIFVKNSAVKGKHIIKAQSVVWVPIFIQDEAFAALTAGSVHGRTITDEDIKDLEILAAMCTAFIDRTNPSIESVAEKTLKTKFKHWLDPAECYIVTERRPEKSFEIFVDLVTHGISGFAVSRMHPGKLKKEFNLVKTPVLWLSRSGRGNTIAPDDLPKLSYIIGDFTRKSGESVILLDGVEYLITQTGFETVSKYLQELRDVIIVNNSRLIIPLHRDALSLREYSVLEREFQVLES